MPPISGHDPAIHKPSMWAPALTAELTLTWADLGADVGDDDRRTSKLGDFYKYARANGRQGRTRRTAEGVVVWMEEKGESP